MAPARKPIPPPARGGHRLAFKGDGNWIGDLSAAFLHGIGTDAVAKIKAGADVVQIYTGLIYKGPALVKEAALAIRDRAK